MTLDDIIKKYGTHELDIDFCKRDNNTTFVYAYCHQHNIGSEFMVNHYLKIGGDIIGLEFDVDNKDDINLHIANIEKAEDGNYEIYGVGGRVRFCVNSNLSVTELSEHEYQKQIRENELN